MSVACSRHPTDHVKLDAKLLQSVKEGGTATVLHLLQEGANVNARVEKGGPTATEMAAVYGHRDVVELLLGRGADPVAAGLSANVLSDAARNGLATQVALILERGVDQKTATDALFAMCDQPMVLPVAMPASAVTVKTDRVLPDIHMNKTVGLLLDHGAKIEARSYNDATPLIWAAQFGATEVVKPLLSRGADVEARNNEGDTALITAACECAVIDMPETLDSMKLLLKKGAKVNARDKHGQTALMAAAFAGRTENMELLLDSGAQIELRDWEGNTALLVSAGAGPYTGVGVVYTVAPVKLLLSRGADLEAKNNRGDTALMLAASSGGYEDLATVRLLLDKGASVGTKNKRGRTALDLALKHHRDAIVRLLRSYSRVPN